MQKVLGTLENGVQTGKPAFSESVWAGAVIDGALSMPQPHWEAIVEWKLVDSEDIFIWKYTFHGNNAC